MDVLDEIARLKPERRPAVRCGQLADLDRAMARRGWVPHCPSRWHRHFIKRFYGVFPEPAAWLRTEGAAAD